MCISHKKKNALCELWNKQYVISPVSHYWIICLCLLSRLLIPKHLLHCGKKDIAISSYIYRQ